MYWTWKSVYDIRKKETIAVKIQKSIDDAINQCKNLYDGIYRYNKEIDWIEKYENNRFRKSWIHTINTNTAAIATLLNFINENYTRQITEDDFLFYPDETCEYFRKCLLEHPEIFLPNNDVFITMYFETQLSWNLSIIGQLRSSLTISSLTISVSPFPKCIIASLAICGLVAVTPLIFITSSSWLYKCQNPCAFFLSTCI